MSAATAGFILGAAIGGGVGFLAAAVLSAGGRADSWHGIDFWKAQYELSEDEREKEAMARRVLGDQCRELYYMLGDDRCQRCTEMGLCAHEIDPSSCAIADRLCAYGVEVD